MLGFFQTAGPVYLLLAAMAECAFAFRAWRQFSPEQPMWLAWGCLWLAALSRAAGTVLAHIIAPNPAFAPANAVPGREDLHSMGLALGGPTPLVLLLVAFAITLQVYRSLGWRARLRLGDYVLVALIGVHALRQGMVLAAGYLHELRDPWKVVHWLTDPLLAVLMALALLLWRTAGSFSSGLVGWCWGSYAVGIFLTAVGDVSYWAVACGQVSWQNASIVTWLVWYPAAAAYAMAPAFQLEALRLAHRAGR